MGLSILIHPVMLWSIGAAGALGGVAALWRWATADHLLTRSFREAAEGDFEGATQRLRAGADTEDPRGQRYEALGFLYFQRARWQEAADAFAEAATRNPRRLLRRVYQAHSLSRAGRTDEARDLLLAMATERPEDVTPLCGLAILLSDAGDLAAAAEWYWKARQLLSKFPSIQTSEGMGLMETCAEAISRNAVADSPVPSPIM